jgi:hypothetical protein
MNTPPIFLTGAEDISVAGGMMKTTIIARKGYEDEDVIADNWEQASYIPLVGDIVNCFGGINVEVVERELRYDDDQHLTVVLNVRLDPGV